ncbi:hypothetical protein Ahy_Scaffold2g107557 [Arachis hypogaea]|uniref:2-oxo-4-hydroxy-4-carboxy-5-ureidoimidazoline decarboxylase n=1 Tax=Arachis hypogaea TaxID=3818 RepID=A0A444WQC8_ARAHY|nr:hypothetical protein Ahy_Scaffold2g107557 [Arachis hypogaea]
MAMASRFSSLEHAITVARDIWSRKLNVGLGWRLYQDDLVLINTGKWRTKLLCRSEHHEWGSRYEEKFGYVFVTFVAGRTSKDILAGLKMRFNNSHGVELEIALKEELKYIERTIRELLSKKSFQTTDEGDMSAEYSGEIIADTLDGADTDSEDDLDAISSGGYNISKNVELDNIPEKDNETLNTQHREDDVHAAKRAFDLNKLPWFGDDLTDPLSRHCSGFLTKFF